MAYRGDQGDTEAAEPQGSGLRFASGGSKGRPQSKTPAPDESIPELASRSNAAGWRFTIYPEQNDLASDRQGNQSGHLRNQVHQRRRASPPAVAATRPARPGMVCRHRGARNLGVAPLDVPPFPTVEKPFTTRVSMADYGVESAGAGARLKSDLATAIPCHPRVTKLPSRITFSPPQ